ncbi:MAG: hypothetical protein JSW50_00630 [Candidatus Latescibacterota bacterium]|nr:MAG: hypothetical protein JSW50_00630 [Candidatus Latescibacterota bacterium]
MSKVVLFAASLLVVAGIASAGIIDPCGSPVDYTGPVIACLFACPQGDGQTYSEAGFTLAFTVNDLGGNPIPDIPASDFWLIDCDPTELELTLCAGSASSAADSATNSAGQTTMSNGTLNAGGCADGLTPVVQGFLLELAPQCDPYCFDIRVRTPDLDGNLEINLVDLANFSACFPPQLYDKCCDFDCNATVNLQDLARFAFHFGPPGHKCQ